MKTHCTNYNNVYALVGEHQQKKPPFRVAFLLSVATELVVVFSQNFLYLFRSHTTIGLAADAHNWSQTASTNATEAVQRELSLRKISFVIIEC